MVQLAEGATLPDRSGPVGEEVGGQGGVWQEARYGPGCHINRGEIRAATASEGSLHVSCIPRAMPEIQAWFYGGGNCKYLNTTYDD